MRQRAEEIGGRLAVTSPTAPAPWSAPICPLGAPMTIRILLVDDHPLFLDGVRAALAGADDLEVVGEAHDGAAGDRAGRRARPDVVLMDLNLPGRLGHRGDPADPGRRARRRGCW